MNTTVQLTIDNFTEQTGFRFRISKLQAARIAVTALDDQGRTDLAGMSVDEAANFLNARNPKGKPLNWVAEAIELVRQGWQTEMELDREGAFREFLEDGGLERLQGRRSDIPDSVYLDPELTVSNFAEKVKAAIGVSCRFRVTLEQSQRIANGELTREGALAEIVEAKRNRNE